MFNRMKKVMMRLEMDQMRIRMMIEVKIMIKVSYPEDGRRLDI